MCYLTLGNSISLIFIDQTSINLYVKKHCCTHKGGFQKGQVFGTRKKMSAHLTCTTHGLSANAMMSRSSQKKAESERLIISNLLSTFIAYTFWEALCLTYTNTQPDHNKTTSHTFCENTTKPSVTLLTNYIIQFLTGLVPHSQNNLKIKLINTLWEAVLPSTQTSHILKHPLLLCFRHNAPTQPLSDNWQRRILGNHVVCVCRLVQTYPTASLPWLSQTHIFILSHIHLLMSNPNVFSLQQK